MIVNNLRLPVVTGRPVKSRDPGLMLISELAARLGVRGNTIYQWTRTGRLSADRQRIVKLANIKIPSGMATSMAAYHEFIELLNNETYESDEEKKSVDLSEDGPAFILNGNVAMIRLTRDDIRWICNRLPNGDRLRQTFATVLTEFVE